MQLPSAIIYNANFRNVWIGQILCQSANKATMIVLLWWSLDRAGTLGSGAWANGALLMANALPAILLAPFIARGLQRRSSRSVMALAQGAAALGLGAMWAGAASHTLALPTAIALSAVVAAGQACVDAALNRSVCELVARADLEQAVALEAATQPLASLGGTALGAVAAGAAGLAPVLSLCAAAYAAAAWLTLRARFSPAGDRPDSASDAQVFDASRDDPRVVRLLRVFAIANFLLFPVFLVLPSFTRNTLQGTVAALGWLEGGFWCGLMAGTALARQLPHHPEGLPRLVGAALVAFGTALAAMAASRSAPGAAAGLLVGGVAVGVVNVKVLSYFQQAVADERKPAFFARLQAWVGAGQPLGYATFTLVLSRVEPAMAFAAQGCGLLLLGAPLLLWRTRSTAVQR